MSTLPLRWGILGTGTIAHTFAQALQETATGRLVAVGSRDGNRFYPGMGTLFLRMMGEALAVALKRFDG